ncbi:MAG: phospho-N-acetylmuramoyl-pentapeptide-transferase [Bacilli bacterium]|nr:phospho-N-acetylmuramoyl-pentapeptide-transferase [Bacilli bacterium]
MLKTITLTILIGLIFSFMIALILIPVLIKIGADQRLSEYLKDEHKKKAHTPTMGGLIFILPPLLVTTLLLIFHKISFSYNLLIVMITFFLYALIGFIDDYLIIKYNNNNGLSEKAKFIMQFIVALIFMFLFLHAGNEPLLWLHSLNLKLDIGFSYGFFIIIILLSSSNAVNITDGLDGLAGGLSLIALITFVIIILSTGWLEGYYEIAIFILILIGSLITFLFFNIYPAKIFMGDTGSLALGSLLGVLAILTRHEILLILICIVFVLETLSCVIQRIYYKIFKRRILPMTPIHHTFEKKYPEFDVVKIFWLIGLIASLISLICGVIL